MSKHPVGQALVLGLLLALPLGSSAGEPKPASPVGAGYSLTWHDEFDGDRLDTGKWTYRIDTRFWSVQRAENVSVADGYLRLALKKGKQAQSRVAVPVATTPFTLEPLNPSAQRRELAEFGKQAGQPWHHDGAGGQAVRHSPPLTYTYYFPPLAVFVPVFCRGRPC